MLLTGVFYLSLGGILCAARWAYNRGERRGVATVATLGGAATLRGGTTLGCGVTLGGSVDVAVLVRLGHAQVGWW